MSDSRLSIKEMRKAYQKRQKEWKKALKMKGTNKYHAERTGGRHSGLEKSVEGIIAMRNKAGEIELQKAQDKITFYINGKKILSYIPDFRVKDLKTGEIFWIESKGFEDALWPVKLALWEVAGPGKLEIWKGDAARPFLHETIIPMLPTPGVTAE